MKRKSININQVKFLMERMEKKYTFDESIERVRTLMNEGIGDDIIKAAIRSTDEASVIKYANDIKVLEKRGSNLTNSIENFRNSFDNIQSGKNLRDSLQALPSARSMRITIENFTDSFSNLLKNISADKGVIIGIDDIKNYINGVTDTYPTELLDVLNLENLAQLQIVQDGIKKLNLTNRELGHLNDFAEIIRLSGNKPMDTRNLLISLIGRDGVESIDELKKSISDLDDLENLDFELANELNDAWKRIKEETGLSSKSIDSQIQTVFRNDPAYKIVEGGINTRIRNWVNSNLKKMDISLEKLKTKNVEWDKTIIYKNAKDGEIYVLQFKSADDVKRYKAYLNKYGLEFKEGAKKWQLQVIG
jgi:hypothetical protein